MNFKKCIFIFIITNVFITNILAQAILESTAANIGSVRLTIPNIVLSYPIMDLGSAGGLDLSFDDRDNDFKNYNYRIQLCNADWTRSEIDEMEYINGFATDQFRNYKNSARTYRSYVHYQINLPNSMSQIKRSGNYVVKVYVDGAEDKPAFVRRFMVVEPRVRISSKFPVPAGAGKNRTHQEIDFTVDYKGTVIRNPDREVQVTVLQNGRWDNALTNLKPNFQVENQLVYDYQDKIVFPAGKEFRRLDLTSVRNPCEGVHHLEGADDGIEAICFRNNPRRENGYDALLDANGKSVIKVQQFDDWDAEADYVNTHFALATAAELNGADVYVFGGLTNWACNDQNKMQYNTSTHDYELTLPLKQGFHNYMYAVKNTVTDDPALRNEINTSRLEGDYFETENDYIIVVYYKPWGDRCDRIIAAQTINSLKP